MYHHHRRSHHHRGGYGILLFHPGISITSMTLPDRRSASSDCSETLGKDEVDVNTVTAKLCRSTTSYFLLHRRKRDIAEYDEKLMAKRFSWTNTSTVANQQARLFKDLPVSLFMASWEALHSTTPTWRRLYCFAMAKWAIPMDEIQKHILPAVFSQGISCGLTYLPRKNLCQPAFHSVLAAHPQRAETHSRETIWMYGMKPSVTKRRTGRTYLKPWNEMLLTGIDTAFQAEKSFISNACMNWITRFTPPFKENRNQPCSKNVLLRNT